MSKLVIIVVAVAVLLAVLAVVLQGKEYREFMKHAQKVNGEIVEREERIADQKTRRKEYWITYRYTDDKQVTHTTQALIEYEDIWKRLRRGQVEPIYYNKENPSESYLALVLDRRLGIADKVSGKTNR